MLTLTSPVRTWAHGLRAWVKLGALCLWTVAVLRMDGLWLAAATALVVGLAASGGRVFFTQWLAMLRPLWPFAVLIMLWQLWLGAPLAAWPILARLGAAVGLANGVTMTTELAEIIALLTHLARPLAKLGLNPKVLGLSVALVMRFVPVMLLRYDQISIAFRARSARRPGWRILMPVLLAALDDADHVAEALRARGGAG
jgi:biotin transport system permease protein